ncbi:hypothetical protein FKW77_003589 [Venturia effusa]|uniref:S-adenosylmethionine transporter n=1 Tax=Venturia effusa TaxID=50376 RepID=A0A517LF81_9PEZI|nr:hypothetical protein FKW77_003589 [Venturia effusa]
MSANTNTDILLAGAIAAFTVDLLVYPLDTLKTRLQSPDYKKRFTNGATNTLNKAAMFRGLYQGVGSVIIATLPSSGAFFTTYEAVKHNMTVYNPVLNGDTRLLPQPIIHALASSTAELVSCAILTPAEVIKQNAQMVDSAAAAKTNATIQTLQRFRSNPLGLWRGYTALAGRNLPFTALQFPMFERLKVFIRDYRDKRGIRTGTLLESGLITATSAGVAGSISAVVTTPIDVVKTRIMLAAAENAANEAPNPKQKTIGKALKAGGEGLVDAVGHTMKKKISKKSSMQIGQEIVAEHGWRGLWRGGALRGIWTMLGSGLYLGVYESGRIYLASRRGAKIEEDELL